MKSWRMALAERAAKALVKPMVARVPGPPELREAFESSARRNHWAPPGAIWRNSRLGDLEAVWVSVGRPQNNRVVFWIHGGAFVCGSPETHRHMAAALAKRMRCEAVLPRYPLAPEEPFPAAIDALTGAYRALIARVPRGRVTVAGDSAGGCLTLALLGSLPAAEQPGAAVAISPVVDLSGTGGTLDAHAAGDVLLPRGRFDEMRGMYLGEHPVTDPRASPVHAVFNAPPPVLFHVSAGEMLFGDTKRMVAALTAQGHEPAVQIWPNAFHVFHLMQGIVPEAAAAMDHIATFIDRFVPPTGS